MKRKETIIFNKSGDEMYRVFRSYSGKGIVIVVHDRDFEAAEIIIEICAQENGFVYSPKGKTVDRFSISKWSNKRVAEFLREWLEDHDRYC